MEGKERKHNKRWEIALFKYKKEKEEKRGLKRRINCACVLKMLDGFIHAVYIPMQIIEASCKSHILLCFSTSYFLDVSPVIFDVLRRKRGAIWCRSLCIKTF